MTLMSRALCTARGGCWTKKKKMNPKKAHETEIIAMTIAIPIPIAKEIAIAIAIQIAKEISAMAS